MQQTKTRKKRIELSLPLDQINAASAREMIHASHCGHARAGEMVVIYATRFPA